MSRHQTIDTTLAPGIYRLRSGGFRVKVAVGDRKRGGQSSETTFPKGTALRKMVGWQTDERARLRRMSIVPATGTLKADIPRYLNTLAHKARLAKDRKYQLEAWVERFGTRRRHTIMRSEIQQQVKAWERDGIAASSIRHRLTALSKLYEELDSEDGNNPVKGVKRPSEPEPRPDARPVEMIEKVLDELWHRVAMNNRGWITLARALVLTHTGMRPSQVMRLDVDIDIVPYLGGDVPFVQVSAGKGGKAYLLPLTQDGKAAFLLFLRVGAAGEFSTQAFYKSWMLACDQANVPRFNPYKLRHSFATLLRRNGADLADVQALLGHKSPKTTARYADVSREKLVDAVQRLERGWNGSRSSSTFARSQHPHISTSSRR
jgi:site-specific recombinase XerD